MNSNAFKCKIVKAMGFTAFYNLVDTHVDSSILSEWRHVNVQDQGNDMVKEPFFKELISDESLPDQSYSGKMFFYIRELYQFRSLEFHCTALYLLISHRFPVNPAGHLHEKSSTLSVHTPPF